jgi:hypothetical protein
MTTFSDMLENGKSAPPPPRRRGLLLAICLVAAVLLAGMTITGVTIAHRMEAPPTAAEAAELACKTTDQELQLSLSVMTGYELPDVGQPKAVIVAPACYKISDLPMSDPGHFVKRVNVYIMVTPAQLDKLFGDDISELDYDQPYPLDTPALKHLVSTELQHRIDSDPTHVAVDYMVTSGPMPTKPTVKEGYERIISPYDALTGQHFDRLPFITADVFESGPPIVIQGSK